MKKISGKYRNQQPNRYNGSELSDIVTQLCNAQAPHKTTLSAGPIKELRFELSE
jgi:hypothetical protein